jgi:hypothetical protein
MINEINGTNKESQRKPKLQSTGVSIGVSIGVRPAKKNSNPATGKKTGSRCSAKHPKRYFNYSPFFIPRQLFPKYTFKE